MGKHVRIIKSSKLFFQKSWYNYSDRKNLAKGLIEHEKTFELHTHPEPAFNVIIARSLHLL